MTRPIATAFKCIVVSVQVYKYAKENGVEVERFEIVYELISGVPQRCSCESALFRMVARRSSANCMAKLCTIGHTADLHRFAATVSWMERGTHW